MPVSPYLPLCYLISAVINRKWKNAHVIAFYFFIRSVNSKSLVARPQLIRNQILQLTVWSFLLQMKSWPSLVSGTSFTKWRRWRRPLVKSLISTRSVCFPLVYALDEKEEEQRSPTDQSQLPSDFFHFQIPEEAWRSIFFFFVFFDFPSPSDYKSACLPREWSFLNPNFIPACKPLR